MREDTTLYRVHSFFFFQPIFDDSKDHRIHSRKRKKKKEKREKTGDMKRWLKSVCTGLQRASRRYRTTAEI